MTIAGDTHVGKSQEGRGLYEIGPENESLFSRISKDWLLLGILLLTATASFGMGLLVHAELLSPSKGEGLWIENLTPQMKASFELSSSSVDREARQTSPTHVTQAAAAVESLAHTGEVVAAKTGTSYYLPTCSGVKRIKEENKVWFKTRALAEEAGYKASKSCKGL